ncbi:MAG: hypothetical protein U0457_02120 [Candidatus Sericytochromatia bacterium]
MSEVSNKGLIITEKPSMMNSITNYVSIKVDQAVKESDTVKTNISSYVSNKVDQVIKSTKTESNEILEANTKKALQNTDQATFTNNINNNPINQVNSIKFDPANKLPERLRETYRSIEKTLNPTEKAALESLLNSNKLTLTDSKNKTVLENLAEIKNGSKQKGVNSEALLKDAILVLSDRKYITQGPHGTCGAGSVQNHLWVKDPAEMLRIVKDLAKSGECELRDGYKLKAGTNSLTWHEGNKTTDGSSEDRRDFNIIFQSAIMRDIAEVGGDRDIIAGRFADYNVNKDNSDAPSVATGDSAADPNLMTGLMKSITGKSYSLSTSFLFGGGGRISELEKASKEGKQPIALFSQDGYFGLHYVVVQEVKDGKIYFQNTAHSRDYGNIDSMSIEDFKSKVRSVVIPK